MAQDLFLSPDYLLVDELLTEEHKLIRASVRQWVTQEVSPIIDASCQQAVFPRHLIKGLAQTGCFGPFIPPEYGGAGLDDVAYGLMMQELERGDSGIRSTASVQGSLVMYPIYMFGTERQKQHYLPRLAAGEIMGCFGLTEPGHGSDPASMETRLRDEGDYLVLDGAKMWISNAPFADVAVVWARDEQGVIRGVIVERGMEGFSTPETRDKWSLRASATGELVFQGVRLPRENLLPGAEGLRAPLSCLDSARYGIAWGTIGAAMDCYDTALRYAGERVQFGKTLASFQLQQKKLAEMITDITKAQLINWRVGTLKTAGKATSAMISMAKRNGCETALRVAREARQILGAIGITGAYPVMRHMMNLESVITYEGTHDIHLLITGQDITGVTAFK
jgi:glutaryl-CoA dehydrogenase